MFPLVWLGSQVWLGSLVWLGTTAFLPGTAAEIDLRPITHSTPDDEWDALFSRTQGWTGGDVAGTVELGDGRTVWVFGDSWIGRVVDGKHAPGSHLVNNSIAVHRQSERGRGEPPPFDQIRFFWGPNDEKGKPAAWVAPIPPVANRWFWANGGGIVAPGPNGQPRLIVFLFHVAKGTDEGSVWNFKTVGSAMAMVDNVQRPANQWKVHSVPIPHDTGIERAGDTTVRGVHWGVSALQWPEPPQVKTHDVYLFGVHTTQNHGKRLMVARVAAGEIENFDRWRFYAGAGQWSPDLNDAVAIADNVASELSIDTYEDQGRSTLIMVHSEPIFGRRILVRTAPRPEGPWSRPRAVHTVPGLNQDKEHFTYAAKGHLHLSRPGELLVTYIVNSHNFWNMVADARIYRPRFVRVPLDTVLKPDSGTP